MIFFSATYMFVCYE